MNNKKDKIFFWSFVLPALLALIMVVGIPLIVGIYYSFTTWNGIDAPTFVGIKNYSKILKDADFMKSIWFTTKFALVSIVLINFIGLSLALIVTQNIKSSKFLRTVFFMPNLIGGLILGFIWQFIFVKAFDSIGTLLNIEALKGGWLATPETGFWGLVILMCWQMSGYIMIIYIAYLQNIPQDLLEAAEIDGASWWQRFRHITFPLVAPGFTVSMFMTLSNSFKLYDQNLSLTREVHIIQHKWLQ